MTKEFFDLIQRGYYEVYISDVVLDEIRDAPETKKNQLLGLVKKYNPIELEVTSEAKDLAVKYIEKKIVPEKKENDALHVAIATVNEADALVSWNYHHLANLRKAELFHGANLRARNFNNFLRQEIPKPCRGFGGLQAIPRGVTAEEKRVNELLCSVIGAIAHMNKLASDSEPNLEEGYLKRIEIVIPMEVSSYESY